MLNQPLNSSEQSKILIFILLLAPSVVFGVGAIPALFLGFGLYMMKKNEDFSHIEVAVRYFGIYSILALVYSVSSGIYWANEYYYPEDGWFNFYMFLGMGFAIIPFTYLVLVKILFFNPLKSHREWVEINGIFSSKPKTQKALNGEPEVDIIKGEKLKLYSVADELIKWAKLKEDGHISEEEYNNARQKLLKK